MMLAKPLRGAVFAIPSCSHAGLDQRTRFQSHQRRSVSSLPPAIAPLFQYAADCNVTQGIQLGMEALHNTGLPWASAFVVSGIALRLATSPFHIYAEKLLAKRIHAQNFFTQGILKKLSQHYKIELAPNEAKTKLELKTTDNKVTRQAEKLIAETVPQYLSEHNLQASRIQNLKMATVPVWLFSSFALRNVISSDFHPNIPGGLWCPDLLVPDPYFILPVAVGLFGFLNIWSQRRIFPVQVKTWRTKSYDFFLGSFTMFAVTIMAQLPACIPLYWLIVSSTGLVQSQILRHPKIKSLLGIQPLPTDSRTPFRDLFLRRSV